ncbi:hypothetical protein [Pseudescherichia vulneris]|nr:hypothetical protein [Pseudescherichia vulneris]
MKKKHRFNLEKLVQQIAPIMKCSLWTVIAVSRTAQGIVLSE